ncbi:MAG TPA: hypothetical protein VF314_03480, partial [Actinomycetes bacterium]
MDVDRVELRWTDDRSRFGTGGVFTRRHRCSLIFRSFSAVVNIALRSVVAYRMTAGPTPLPLSVALSRVAHPPLGGLLLGALPARFARQTV